MNKADIALKTIYDYVKDVHEKSNKNMDFLLDDKDENEFSDDDFSDSSFEDE